jgi:crotonobetaine/carnitine-CoA ligase
LPMFHTNARYCTVLIGLMLSVRVVLHRSFSASRFWDVCRAEEATAFNFIGSMLTFLSKQPPRADDRDHLVRKGYGAPAPISIYHDFEERFGVRLCEAYGSSEIGCVTANPIAQARPGSAGRSTGIHELAIHDPGGNPVPEGEAGEIVVRPKRPGILFNGYHGMPAETAASWRDLWFHTGDRGRFDEDGNLYFVDRVKDSIRRRGENISSWEVERVVNSIDVVQECAVLGVASDASEEDVLVVVVLKEREELEPLELLGQLESRLPAYAMPRYVRYVESLPKTPTGRVQKYMLRRAGKLPNDWDHEVAMEAL